MSDKSVPLEVFNASVNDRYAPLWQPGDQCADTDGMAAAWDDARMYGSGFVLNGERIDPVLVVTTSATQTVEWAQPSDPLSWNVSAPSALGSCYDNGHPTVLHNDWPAAVPSRLHEMARRVEELEAQLEHAQNHALECGEMAIKRGDELLSANLRVLELEVENERLRSAAATSDMISSMVRAERDAVVGPNRRRLSATWEHLDCVTSPVARTFPVNALRHSPQVVLGRCV